MASSIETFIALLDARILASSLASIREDGGDHHFPAIGIVISELHIGSETLAVITRVDEAECHPNPQDENPGQGLRPRLSRQKRPHQNSVQTSGGG